jgi:ketosteroid isomerase-like protein
MPPAGGRVQRACGAAGAMAVFSNRRGAPAGTLVRMNTTADNQQLLERAFAAFAEGDAAPFFACLADDVAWTITGSTPFSRTYVGKEVVQEQLRGPLAARLATPLRLVAHRVLAAGDHVVVESRGHAQTRSGEAYANAYCMVFRLADGRVRELTEYMDTAHVLAVFAPAR